MKRTDDYQAKLKMWVREKRVYPLPKVAGVPRFSPKKFNSHEEMNAWKGRLLDEIARAGGVRWTK